jgi:hypothetical protein
MVIPQQPAFIGPSLVQNASPTQSGMALGNSDIVGYQNPPTLPQGISTPCLQSSSNNSIVEHQMVFTFQSVEFPPPPYSQHNQQNTTMPEGQQEVPQHLTQKQQTGGSRTDAIVVDNEDKGVPREHQPVKQSIPTNEQNQLTSFLSEEPEQMILFRWHPDQDFLVQSIEIDSHLFLRPSSSRAKSSKILLKVRKFLSSQYSESSR